MAGLAIEPLWVWFNNKTTGTGGDVTVAHAPGQSRHTLGGRVAYRQNMFDGTAEAYWQTGHFDMQNGQNLSINAVAMAVEGPDDTWEIVRTLDLDYRWARLEPRPATDEPTP